MRRHKTIHIRVSNAVIQQISLLADKEERSPGEMVRTLLEDALALRETITITDVRGKGPGSEA